MAEGYREAPWVMLSRGLIELQDCEDEGAGEGKEQTKS